MHAYRFVVYLPAVHDESHTNGAHANAYAVNIKRCAAQWGSNATKGAGRSGPGRVAATRNFEETAMYFALPVNF